MRAHIDLTSACSFSPFNTRVGFGKKWICTLLELDLQMTYIEDEKVFFRVRLATYKIQFKGSKRQQPSLFMIQGGRDEEAK